MPRYKAAGRRSTRRGYRPDQTVLAGLFPPARGRRVMRRNLPTQLQVSHRQCVGQLATRLLVSNTNGRSLATRVLHCSFYVFSVSPYNTWLLASRHRVADDLQRLSLQHIFQILAAQAVGGWGALSTVYCKGAQLLQDTSLPLLLHSSPAFPLFLLPPPVASYPKSPEWLTAACG